jgi:hypothetical protein
VPCTCGRDTEDIRRMASSMCNQSWGAGGQVCSGGNREGVRLWRLLQLLLQ